MVVGSFANNILWQNRAHYYDQGAAGVKLLPDPAGVTFTSASCPTASGIGAWRAWDLGIVGITAQTPRLTPSFSILTAALQHGVSYAGASNSFGLVEGHIVGEYCNGARSARLSPEPTTLQAAPALDEGGNWIDVRFGPISLTGDYHLAGGGNPAVNSGTSANAPATDFDGEGRPFPNGAQNFDRGADERTNAAPAPFASPRAQRLGRARGIRRAP
jgi:hypothetical protein